jgi:hypothetical protein
VRRGLVLAAAVLAAALLGAAPAQAALKAIWGPNELRDGRSAFPVYEELGVDVLQKQLAWSRVATERPADPRDPADPAYRWPADVDAAYAETARRGMRLALLVRGTPRWANGGRTEEWVPDDVGDYADFMVAASRRYSRVRHWMVWGEPSRSANFKPLPRDSPVGPRAYSRLLDRAYGALKRERRSNKVIGGMTFHFGEVMPKDFVRWMRLPNGKPPRLDLFGHNPFTGRRPDLRKRVYYPGLRDMSDVDTFVREIRRHWRPRKVKPRLWLSEFCVASDRANPGFSFFVSRRKQASWLSAALKIARRNRWIAGFGWWNLQDGPDPDGITCGLLDEDGKRKPAFRAYKRAR